MQKRLGWLITAILLLVFASVVIFFYHTSNVTKPAHTFAEQANTPSNHDLPTGKKKSAGTPTAIDLKSKEFVANGRLTQVGQYRLTSSGVAEKLVGDNAVNATLQNHNFIYQVTRIARYKNTARSTKALQNARRVLNTPKLANGYETLVIAYRITNDSTTFGVTPGVTTIGFKGKPTMSELNGLVNDPKLSVAGIPAGGYTDATVTVFIPKGATNDIDLQFATVKDRHGNILVGPSAKLRVTF